MVGLEESNIIFHRELYEAGGEEWFDLENELYDHNYIVVDYVPGVAVPGIR